MTLAPSDYTPADVLARAEWAVADRRMAFVDEFDLALRWADLHSTEPEVDVPGGDRMIALGGEGTPAIRDLCLEELAIARGEHVYATRSLLADVLDLRHRMPQLWVAVRMLEVEPWVARKIASMSRKLDRIAVAYVDDAVAHAVGLSTGRLLDLVEAEVIKADEALRARELDNARNAKGVWLTGRRQDNPAGLRGVFARLEAADAIWVDATVQRVAELLGLLDEADGQADPTDEGAGQADEGVERAAMPGKSTTARRAPRPQAILFVHLHQAALAGAGGVARTSELGPLLLAQVTQLLGHAHVTVKPVIDLTTGTSIDGYEHPRAVRERTILRTNGPVFPHAGGNETSRVDHDHPTPYIPPETGGPPGQTGDHNDAPLTRHQHRAKTHLNYQVEQLGHGAYLWTTPNGLIRLVTPTGTHRITEDDLDLVRRLYA